ncbi:Aste57867_3493 [Aphanomyces stellatus]|uniref:Aste57867_3493 protein n=1 Tax=Aphanomyces stellatus TaxID=120398 RepID=A0A485KFL3_9STRA|nr:hypothetical protein As57867_003482 [Aphanomyces stellatus]VFT80657.1 Aste57867_3493 [Aphanomyces stellatus]
MTAVLTIRAEGEKLPILFVMRGKSGGKIETDEFPTFPHGHFYAMQDNAWMDGNVWRHYLRYVLGATVTEPSIIVLDNFDSHVSPESNKIAPEELGCSEGAGG